MSRGIAKQRESTATSIFIACVALERARTDRRVVEEDGVFRQRIKPDSSVVEAGCVAKERLVTIGGVIAKEITISARRGIVVKSLKTGGGVIAAGCVTE
jgi:hypothetical protein